MPVDSLHTLQTLPLLLVVSHTIRLTTVSLLLWIYNPSKDASMLGERGINYTCWNKLREPIITVAKVATTYNCVEVRQGQNVSNLLQVCAYYGSKGDDDKAPKNASIDHLCRMLQHTLLYA